MIFFCDRDFDDTVQCVVEPRILAFPTGRKCYIRPVNACKGMKTMDTMENPNLVVK